MAIQACDPISPTMCTFVSPNPPVLCRFCIHTVKVFFFADTFTHTPCNCNHIPNKTCCKVVILYSFWLLLNKAESLNKAALHFMKPLSLFCTTKRRHDLKSRALVFLFLFLWTFCDVLWRMIEYSEKIRLLHCTPDSYLDHNQDRCETTEKEKSP